MNVVIPDANEADKSAIWDEMDHHQGLDWRTCGLTISATIAWLRRRVPAALFAEDMVPVNQSELAALNRCTNLLAEITEDLSKFGTPEMQRLVPKSVEAINEFVARAQNALDVRFRRVPK